MDKPTEATYTWLILNTQHGKYICSTKLSISSVIQAQIEGAAVECQRVYELYTPLQQVPSKDPTKLAVAKDGLATPLDINAESTTTFFSLHGTRVNFFEHMAKVDREMYERLVAGAREMAAGWRTQRTGIVVPTISLK